MTDSTRSTRRRGAPDVVPRLSKDERMADLESRLARLERVPSLRARGRSMMDKIMPPEASEHFRSAGREQLLGVRSIVDFWIRRLDEADAQAASRSRERETIEIEDDVGA
jgi:hypothetical protein